MSDSVPWWHDADDAANETVGARPAEAVSMMRRTLVVYSKNLVTYHAGFGSAQPAGLLPSICRKSRCLITLGVRRKAPPL
jgi:hypothetical protein